LSFEVKIEVFEGPFDLLLQLILKQDMDIHTVPIAEITASFVERIEGVRDFDLDTATDFLLIAATLLLIKARSLIPREDDDFEAMDDAVSEREFLVERLIEYKQFASAAEWLEAVYTDQRGYMSRTRELEDDYASLYPDPFEGVPPVDLARAFVNLLVRQATECVDTSFVAPIKVSVAERIEEVRTRISKEGRVKFSELIRECVSKIDVIATFLAVLELYKRCEVMISQRRLFGEIEIRGREDEGNVA